MNEINASKRLKEAAYQRAEGEKIVKVKKAEAEAESMYLSGKSELFEMYIDIFFIFVLPF
jgi:hypothetical protein